MQGALYAGTVIIAELADVGNYVVQVRRGNLFGIQDEVAVGESGLRRARQVQDNLQELAEVEHVSERAHDPGRQAMEEEGQIVLYVPFKLLCLLFHQLCITYREGFSRLRKYWWKRVSLVSSGWKEVTRR